MSEKSRTTFPARQSPNSKNGNASNVAKARKEAAEESRLGIKIAEINKQQKEISSLQEELNKLKEEKHESDADKSAVEQLLQDKENEIDLKENEIKELKNQLDKIKRENNEKLEKFENEKKLRENEENELIAEGEKITDTLQGVKKTFEDRIEKLEKEIELRKQKENLQEQLVKQLEEEPKVISEEWKLPEHDDVTESSRERFNSQFVSTFLKRIQHVGTEKDSIHGLDESNIYFSEIIGAHFVRGGMVSHYKKIHKRLCDSIVHTLAYKKPGGGLDTRDSEKHEVHRLEKEYEIITLIDTQLRRKLSQGEWCSLKFYTGDSDLKESTISKSVKLAFLLFKGDGEADSRLFRRYDYYTRELAHSALSGQVDMRDNRVQTFNTEIRTADNNLKTLLGTLSEVARNIQHECRYASELVNQDLRALNDMMEDYQEQKLAVTKLIYSSMMLPISRIIVLLFLAGHFSVEITQRVWSEKIVFKLLNPMVNFPVKENNLETPDDLDEHAAPIYNCILILLHSGRSPVGREDGGGAS